MREGKQGRGLLRLITTQSNETSEAIRQLRERFSAALKRQEEQIENLHQGLRLLQNEQQQLVEATSRLLDLEKTLATNGETKALLPSSILSSLRRLTGATYAEQVFEVLAQEAGRMGSRVAVFDVRGRAAWGATASGFSPELPTGALRTLVVPLNLEGPFRQAFEKGKAVETAAEGLRKNRTLVAKLRPVANARILLLPVRSAGSVAAIFYADTGERKDSVLVDTLKILAEFAGAQVDRLMAISSGLASDETTEESNPGSLTATAASDNEAEAGVGAWEGASVTESRQFAGSNDGSVELPDPALQEGFVAAVSPETAGQPDDHHAPSEMPDNAHRDEDDQKVHRDAQRFSKLLVSEVELYNKSGVEEGRRNKNLYQRLKRDIDRSRETYEKRFANTVASQVDYFHEELVKTLAENDPMLLGPDYPGSSV